MFVVHPRFLTSCEWHECIPHVQNPLCTCFLEEGPVGLRHWVGRPLAPYAVRKGKSTTPCSYDGMLVVPQEFLTSCEWHERIPHLQKPFYTCFLEEGPMGLGHWVGRPHVPNAMHLVTETTPCPLDLVCFHITTSSYLMQTTCLVCFL